jgi:hypothetical protein
MDSRTIAKQDLSRTRKIFKIIICQSNFVTQKCYCTKAVEHIDLVTPFIPMFLLELIVQVPKEKRSHLLINIVCKIDRLFLIISANCKQIIVFNYL